MTDNNMTDNNMTDNNTTSDNTTSDNTTSDSSTNDDTTGQDRTGQDTTGRDTPGQDTTGPDTTGIGTAEKDPSDWVTGDEPVTGPQRSYLETLAREAGEEVPDGLNKAQASELIETLQAKTGRGA